MCIRDRPNAADLTLLRTFGERHGFALYLQPSGPDSLEPLSVNSLTPSYRLPGFDVDLAFQPYHFVQVNAAINRQLVELSLIHIFEVQDALHEIDIRQQQRRSAAQLEAEQQAASRVQAVVGVDPGPVQAGDQQQRGGAGFVADLVVLVLEAQVVVLQPFAVLALPASPQRDAFVVLIVVVLQGVTGGQGVLVLSLIHIWVGVRVFSG